MAKFAVFEIAVENILRATGRSKDSLSSGQTQLLNLSGGVVAGCAAAIVSQPADTLLSKVNKTKGAPGQSVMSRLFQMAGQLGPAGLFTGMGARLVMISTLTAGQCESPLSSHSVCSSLNTPSLHLWRYKEGAGGYSQRGNRCRAKVNDSATLRVGRLHRRFLDAYLVNLRDVDRKSRDRRNLESIRSSAVEF